MLRARLAGYPLTNFAHVSQDLTHEIVQIIPEASTGRSSRSFSASGSLIIAVNAWECVKGMLNEVLES